MIISSAQIDLSGLRGYTSRSTFSERLLTWIGDRPEDGGGRGSPPSNPSQGASVSSPNVPSPINDIVDISSTLSPKELTPPYHHRFMGLKPQGEAYLNSQIKVADFSDSTVGEVRVIKLIIEAVFGTKVDVADEGELSGEGAKGSRAGDIGDLAEGPRTAARGADEGRAGFGVEYDRVETYFESEEVNFNASGVINTADGREISFSLDLDMAREYYTEDVESIRLGDGVRVDPLVINFDGNGAELTSERLAFDLNSDGLKEEIYSLKAGSGLLYLDLNGDGIVTDGGELFGPSTGSGYGELSRYDADGNGWIDSGDPVFGSLGVWTKTGSKPESVSNDLYRSLRGAGIGAIHLSSVETSFGLKDGDNNLNGEIKRTGIYVNEDGTVGTLQELDFIA